MTIKIEKFEDIIAWQKARVLVKDIYQICGLEYFRKDFNLVSQNQTGRNFHHG